MPVSSPGPPLEPRTIVLLFEGSIARVDVPGLCESLRVLLEGTGADEVVCEMGALADPDAVTVDALARLQLTARRLGRQIGLRHACGELRELLALVGLDEVVPLCSESAIEPRREAEQREQPGGIEEEGDSADPPG
jgi:anti-anti-sigma regulatory factor